MLPIKRDDRIPLDLESSSEALAKGTLGCLNGKGKFVYGMTKARDTPEPSEGPGPTPRGEGFSGGLKVGVKLS